MKEYTKTLFGTEAREALLRGIEEVYKPVAATIGARGRNGVYREYGYPTITNDGVSIARKIHPQDKFESIGADLIKEVAEETNTQAGDGTTTAIIIGRALAVKGKDTDNPMKLRRELEEEKDKVIAELTKRALKISDFSDVLNVARISTEDQNLALIVADAVNKAGDYGVVIVEEGAGYEVDTEVCEGYHWDSGYLSPYMINDSKNEAILENPVVIITDRFLNLNKDLMQLLNKLAGAGHKSAFVVADSVDGELLGSLIANKLKGIFATVAVRRPSSLEELEDIAALVGAIAVTKDKGIKEIDMTHVGKASKIIVSKEKTIIVADKNPAVEERIKTIDAELEEGNDVKKQDLLKTRRAKLSDGIVRVRVGAKTEAERKYKRDKIDDAVNACKAALEEGIVAGAGATLYEIAQKIDHPVMKYALEAPYRKILENAGIEPDGKFYNVVTGDKVKDLIKEGIIDPKKVERCAVENAVSLAGAVLTCESVIATFEEKSETAQALEGLGLPG